MVYNCLHAKNQVSIIKKLKLLIDMNGYKNFSCKIPDQYLKNKKDIKLLELWQLCFKKETRPKDLKCCRNQFCLSNNQ